MATRDATDEAEGSVSRALSIETARFTAGDRVIVWGKPAVVLGMYLTHPNIIRFRYDGETAESTVATHFCDGLNPHVEVEWPST